MWPIANSLMNRAVARAPTATHGPLGLTFQTLEKAKAIADCLEKQFTPHDLCEENHEQWLEARAQAVLKL
jgi:hypothetical protein